MIYLNDDLGNQQQFESLLRLCKELVLEQLGVMDSPSLLSGDEFEKIVFDACVEATTGTVFEGKIERTKDREFPDIVAAGYFGIEVKATKKDSWTSIGNSVLESSRYNSVQKIYIFFGKLGGTPDIMYRDYESCLKDIAVTHYPRYQIDMNLENGESIFSKMKIDYIKLRSSTNPVREIRSYYKGKLKSGQSLWWIDDEIDETATTSPIIKNVSSLSQEQKDRIRVDIFVMLPKVFSNSSKKYEDVPAFLISSHGVMSSSVRDLFTASGQVRIEHEGQIYNAPQIIGKACLLKARIIESLQAKDLLDLAEAWQKDSIDYDTTLTAWLAEFDKYTAYLELPVPASMLFSKGVIRP